MYELNLYTALGMSQKEIAHRMKMNSIIQKIENIPAPKQIASMAVSFVGFSIDKQRDVLREQMNKEIVKFIAQ
jgi:ribosome-binding protein aMBF1 (putative translation factor)